MIQRLVLNQSRLGLSTEGRHGRKVDGFPQDVPPGSGILTQGVLEGFPEDPQVFALTLRVKSPGIVYAGKTFLVSLAAA